LNIHSSSGSDAAVRDVSIDDQRGVYIPTPLQSWLPSSSKQQQQQQQQGAGGSKNNSVEQTVMIHGRTRMERINHDDNYEMKLVIQRIHNVITKHEFQTRLKMTGIATGTNTSSRHAVNANANANANLRKLCKKDAGGGGGTGSIHVQHNQQMCHLTCLIQAVEEFVSSSSPTTTTSTTCSSSSSDTIQLFILESIFKSQTPELISLLQSLDIANHSHNSNNSNNHRNHHNHHNSNGGGKQCTTNNNDSGINAAIAKLKQYATNNSMHIDNHNNKYNNDNNDNNDNYCKNNNNIPIAWGNTNSKARDYKAALDIAEQSKRPIIFIPYLNDQQCRQIKQWNDILPHSTPLSAPTAIEDHHPQSQPPQQPQQPQQIKMVLPRISMMELFIRNIHRCYYSGKYVPMKTIIDTCIRVDELIEKAFIEMDNNNTSLHHTNGGDGRTMMKRYEKFQLDFSLAKMAGYHLNRDRTVRKLSFSSTNNTTTNTNSSARQKYVPSNEVRIGNIGRGTRTTGGRGRGRGRGRGWYKSSNGGRGRGRGTGEGRGGNRASSNS
jgi:hypothetical protein